MKSHTVVMAIVAVGGRRAGMVAPRSAAAADGCGQAGQGGGREAWGESSGGGGECVQ